MIFPWFIIDKIIPFTDSFNKDLKSKLDSVDRELSAKGLTNSGAQIKRYQSEFLDSLGELINKIAGIVFNDIKNKQLSKPEFFVLKDSIKQLIDLLINDFKNKLEIKIRQAISKEESVSSVLADFDRDLQSHLDKQFVDVEQNFDAIE